MAHCATFAQREDTSQSLVNRAALSVLQTGLPRMLDELKYKIVSKNVILFICKTFGVQNKMRCITF